MTQLLSIRNNLILVILYFFSIILSYHFESKNSILPVIWLSSGIGLALFLINSIRSWKFIAPALLFSGALACVVSGKILSAGILFILTDMTGYIISAWLIKSLLVENITFKDSKEISVFILTTIVVLPIISFMATWSENSFADTPELKNFLSWWIIDSSGIIMLAPFLITWNNFHLTQEKIRPDRILEFILFVFLICFTSYYMFSSINIIEPITLRPYMVAALLPIIAMRFDIKMITLSCLLMSVFVIISPSVLHTPTIWGKINLDERIMEILIFLNFLSIGMFYLSANFSEKKASERQLKKLTTAVDQSAASIVITDINGTIEYVNPFFTKTTGYSFNEAIGKNPKILKSGFTPQEKYEELWKIISSGKVWRGELSNKKKDGELYWESVSISPILDEKNQITNYIAVKENITEEKRSKEAMKESLHEKEILLSEIHHRVKNNLQLVTSIIKLGANYITDKDVIEKLNNIAFRIEAMGVLHNKLYSSKNFAKIDMKDYLDTISKKILMFQPDSFQKIKFKIDIENIFFNLETATPCGLIVNEIITNAFKHAFTEGKEYEIGISIQKIDDSYQMEVYDFGIGLPENFNIDSNQTLGIQMIKLLAKQLGGSLNIDGSNGTKYTLLFKDILKEEKRWIK